MAKKPSANHPSIYDVKSKHEVEWLKVPGVTGVAVGSRTKGSGLAIKVYVSQPGKDAAQRIPTEVEGYSVEVEVSGEFRAQ